MLTDLIDPVTPEMAQAGVEEIRERFIGEDLAEVVTAVYMAMEYTRRDAAALSAGSGSGAEGWAVPEGYALVPVRLSRPMEDTLEECMAAWVEHEIDADIAWDRTLAAAPPPPAREGGE